jgi:hypothetical protein
LRHSPVAVVLKLDAEEELGAFAGTMPHFTGDSFVLVTQGNGRAYVHGPFGAHGGSANGNIGELKDAVLWLAGLVPPKQINRI